MYTFQISLVPNKIPITRLVHRHFYFFISPVYCRSSAQIEKHLFQRKVFENFNLVLVTGMGGNNKKQQKLWKYLMEFIT